MWSDSVISKGESRASLWGLRAENNWRSKLALAMIMVGFHPNSNCRISSVALRVRQSSSDTMALLYKDIAKLIEGAIGILHDA